MAQNNTLKDAVWPLKLPLEEAATFLNRSKSFHEAASQHRKCSLEPL